MKFKSTFPIALMLCVFGCASAQREVSKSTDGSGGGVITILHTNDMHASFTPHEATGRRESPKPMVGGFSELQFVLDSIRSVKPNVLLFDGGDVMTGNPITDRVYKGADGGALFEMMNMLKYDAWCLGNHDFDISQDNLVKLTKIANFPTLAANVVNANNEFPLNNKEYIILERGGLRIGVFGLMTQELYNLVNQNNLAGIKVLDLSATAQKVIDKIDPETDLIIALTHHGASEDSALATTLHGLDIIVGGHSHTRLTRPMVVNDIIVVQAGTRAENLGELEVTVENDKVVKYNGKLIPIWANASRPKTRLAEFADSIQSEIDRDFDEVIANLKYDWKRTFEGESNIGNWIADIQRDAAHAHVAFMNAGGIRSDVSAGPLTKRELFQVLPFKNTLVTFQLTGKQLKESIQHGIRHDDMLQISGLRIRWKKNADGSARIESIEVGEKPLDPDATYICAASDFLVGQGMKYLGMEVPNPIYLNKNIFQIAVETAKAQKEIVSTIEGRIQEVK